MSARLETPAAAGAIAPNADATHDVTNQAPPLSGYNPYAQDRLLVAAAQRADAGWVAPDATDLGELVGS